MILKSCYIENFGTFHQESFHFTPGLNLFKEENGWGKTTLASFLKAMLYGMEYRQRSKALYERTLYLPWQGGNYGGYLIFTEKQKEYKIMRYFGKKGTEDEFFLYDNISNKPSLDYTKQIGEELLGIDRDSFERSIFITGNGKIPALTDSLSARLGNLIDNTDDINNYENAYSTLDALATSIKAKRGTGGRLGEIQNKMSAVRDQIRQCEEARQQMKLLRKDISDCTQQKAKLETRRKALREEVKTLEAQGQKREYERLLSRIKGKEAQAQNLLSVFGNTIPSGETIKQYMDQARQAENLQNKLKESFVSDAERKMLHELTIFFNHDIPAQEELNICEKRLKRCREASIKMSGCRPTDQERSEYQTTLHKYQKQCPALEDLDQYLEDYARVVDLKEQIHTLQLDAQQQKTTAGHVRYTGKGKALLWAGSFFLFLSILLLILSFLNSSMPKAAGFIAIAGSIVLLLAGVLSQNKAKRTSIDQDTAWQTEEHIRLLADEQRELEQDFQYFLQELGYEEETINFPRLLSDIRIEIAHFWELDAKFRSYRQLRERLQSEISPLQDYCDSFLERFRLQCPPMEDQQLLLLVKEKKERLEDLEQRIREYDHIQAQFDKLSKKLSSFLDTCSLPEQIMQKASALDSSGLPKQPSQDISFLVQTEFLRDQYRDYHNVRKELEGIHQEVLQMQKKYKLAELSSLPECSTDPQILQEEMELCDREADHLLALDTNYNKKWEQLSLQADKQQDFESDYENLSQQEEELQRSYRLLSQTMNFLKKAKERLTTGYMRNTLDAFDKYRKLLDAEGPSILLDAGLDAAIEEYGKVWDSVYFSSGYKDLVTLCTRLALADAIFQGNPPFLILDDPFVNLDEEKIEHALAFLQRLAEQSQVLYFTCHSSRSPELV